jgi:hypothetical protein
VQAHNVFPQIKKCFAFETSKYYTFLNGLRQLTQAVIDKQLGGISPPYAEGKQE